MAFSLSPNLEPGSQLTESRKPENRGPVAELPGFDLFPALHLPSVSLFAMCHLSSASPGNRCLPTPYNCMGTFRVPFESRYSSMPLLLPSISNSTEERISVAVSDIKRKVKPPNCGRFPFLTTYKRPQSFLLLLSRAMEFFSDRFNFYLIIALFYNYK